MVVAIDAALDALTWVAFGALSLSSAIAGVGIRSLMRRFDGQVLMVAAPAADGMPEDFFAALHGLLRPRLGQLRGGQPWVRLDISSREGRVRFGMWVPRCEDALVKALLRGAYPGVEIGSGEVRATEVKATAVANAHLAQSEYVGIRTSFEGEALSTVVATLAAVAPRAEVSVELLVRPKTAGWSARALAYADSRRRRRSTAGGRRISFDSDRGRAAAVEQKAASAPFDCALRVIARASDRESARELVRVTVASLGPFAGPNRLVFGPTHFPSSWGTGKAPRAFPLFGCFVLTARELAGLWHLPREPLARVAIVRSPKLAPPPGASGGDRVLGLSNWGDVVGPIGLSTADSRHHLHLLGSTGTGKTTALLNLATQDINAGRGVAVLDPKGDLVRGILARIPRQRLDDVILIAPDDGAIAVGINPLEIYPGDDPDLVVENTLSIFKRIYERSWGMRTDDILKATLLTLLRRPDPTLAHIPLLLTDPVFRLRTIRGLRDPLGLDSFWVWFGKLSEHQRNEAIGPVLNKLRDFLVRPRLRRVLCQLRSTVDPRELVDSGKILLADLSVGLWGETTASLIGSFLVARIWQAVLARSGVEEDSRRPFYLYIDEFQHFLGMPGPFGDALAEARSLGLSLTIANQHLGQLPREIREAIGSNARSRLVFQCGQDDASYLAREFAPLDATALMSLPRFEMAARISIAGQTSEPFTLRTLPPPRVKDVGIAAEARAASLGHFGREVGIVDGDLQAALAPTPPSASVSRVGVRTRP